MMKKKGMGDDSDSVASGDLHCADAIGGDSPLYEVALALLNIRTRNAFVLVVPLVAGMAEHYLIFIGVVAAVAIDVVHS
jgi:hypothetical protein